MSQIYDVGLSSWSLGLNSPVLRHPFRRPALRHPDFEDRYDFQTVFYDCFRSADGRSLRLIGPPLQNLADSLGLRFFAMPSGEEITARVMPRVFVTLLELPAPPGLEALRIESAAGTAIIVPQPNLSGLFAGKRVLMTLSQNNELAWIRDWIIYHQRLHGCDAALVYDNNSSRYEVAELAACVGAIPGVTGIAIGWPFRYGPFDGRLPLTYDLWEGHFCQFGMLEHARYRFLPAARAGLNLDIDELVICPDGQSICALVEGAATGFLAFGGKWVEPYRSDAAAGGTPLHRHFRHRKRGRTQGCEKKYAVVPARVPDSAQFGIHDIFGHVAGSLPAGVELRHFKAINTNWTVDRPGTLKARTEAGDPPEELAEDRPLAALLDAAFAGCPEDLDAAPLQDGETALYRARLKSAQLLRGQRLAEAEGILRAALAAQPGWPSLQQFHARLLAALGAGDAAQAELAEAARRQDADPAAIYERGRYLLHTGDWPGAARALHRAIRREPGFAPAFLALGRAYWTAGRQRAAERIIRSGLAASPQSALLHGALAEMLLHTGRPRDALEEARQALARQPDNIHVLLVASRARRELGEADAALEAASRAVALQDDAAVLMRQFGQAIDHPFDYDYPVTDRVWAGIEMLHCLLLAGRMDDAEARSRQLVAAFPDRAEVQEARAFVLGQRGEDDAAAAALAQAIRCAERDLADMPPQTMGRYRELQSQDGKLRRLYRLLKEAGRDAEASALVAREMEIQPTRSLAALQLHELLAAKPAPAEARERIAKALRGSPRDAWLWQELGRALEALGDGDGAIAAYRKALQHGTPQPWLLSHVAQLLIRQSSDRPEALAEAEDALREALALNDGHALSHYRYGDLLWRRKRQAEAIAAWRKAAGLAPEEAWLWSHLGAHLVDAGELDDAAEALERAAAMRPRDALTQFRLGRLHEERRDAAAALAHMARAVELDPGKAWMWRHYGKLLAHAGRAADAAAAKDRARSLEAEAAAAPRPATDA